MIEKNFKYYLGISLIVYSFLPYIFVFTILPFLELSTEDSLTLSTILIVSSEGAFFIAVALLGKQFVNLIKQNAKSYFLHVSKSRYNIGLVMFVISMIVPTFSLELLLYFDILDSFGEKNALYLLLSMDALFIVSLFVLGGDFWEKVKKLFEYPQKDTQNS
jgi:hypothetical protein